MDDKDLTLRVTGIKMYSTSNGYKKISTRKKNFFFKSIKTVGATVSSGQIDLASDLDQEYIYFMGIKNINTLWVRRI